MKNSIVFNLTISNFIIALTILAILIGIVLFFMPRNTDNASVPLTHPDSSVSSVDNQFLESEPIKNDLKTISSESNNSQSTIPPISESFINKIEIIIASIGTRTHKMASLMDIINSAQSDDEKITALQALSMLNPIEYADELINFANSNQQSEKVRSAAVDTLNDAYLLNDDLVQQIGGSTAFTQSEKISTYMDSLVNDPTAAQTIREAALAGYSYTNDEKAIPMAVSILGKGQPPTSAEAEFLTSTLFSNEESLDNLLPIIVKNPQLLTDDLVMQISTIASEPAVLEDMKNDDRITLVNLLQNYEFDPADPMYDVNQELLQTNLLDIGNKNIR